MLSPRMHLVNLHLSRDVHRLSETQTRGLTLA